MNFMENNQATAFKSHFDAKVGIYVLSFKYVIIKFLIIITEKAARSIHSQLCQRRLQMGLASGTFYHILLVSSATRIQICICVIQKCVPYSGIITCMSVYRGKSSIYEYLAAGSITGSLYKVSLGLRGMAAGGIIGGFLGGVAGVTSLLLMKASGTSMEEVRYWQYKWRLDRDENIQQAFKKLTEDENPELFKAHDEKTSEHVSLDTIK